MRGAFGHHSQVFSRKLSDEQLGRWILAGAQVMSNPRLGQNGPLTGQQLYASINSVRSRVDLPETLEPPAPVAFGRSVVGELVIENTEAGVRLRLRPAQAPERGLPGAAAASGGWDERHHLPLPGPVWRAPARHEGVYRHLPAEEWLEGD